MVTPYIACGSLHGLLRVCDDDELRVRGHLAQQAREPLDVGLVQRRVRFVQNAKRARLITEDRHQRRHRRQRFLAAREQQHVLQLLARRRGHDGDN